jgi:YHS domain-containing protein
MKKAIIIGVAAIVIGILFIVRLYSVDLQVRKPTQQELGEMVNFCTVKKIKFQITKETPVIDYKGKTYYFCCTHCLGEFQRNPDKYAKQLSHPDFKGNADQS